MDPASPTLPEDLGTRFARRVAERDIVRDAAPAMTPEAIAGRLDAWLHGTYALRQRPYRARLVQMLLLLLAQPEASSVALGAAAGLQPCMTARSLTRLGNWGLTERLHRGVARHYRLTRAAEDALLPVVQGAAAG